MRHWELLAPAKINLYLDIVGRRADGYHLLDTVMAPVGLADSVHIYLCEAEALLPQLEQLLTYAREWRLGTQRDLRRERGLLRTFSSEELRLDGPVEVLPPVWPGDSELARRSWDYFAPWREQFPQPAERLAVFLYFVRSLKFTGAWGEEGRELGLDWETNSLHRSQLKFLAALEEAGRRRGWLDEDRAAPGAGPLPALWALGLCKRIPQEAGLGGGSADAAALLRFLFAALDALDLAELLAAQALDLAASVGADVPYTWSLGLCHCRGIGEELKLLGPCPDWPCLLLKPLGLGLSTPEAFRRYDDLPPERRPPQSAAGIVEALLWGDWSQLQGRAQNAFAHFLPEGYRDLEAILDLGRAYGAIHGGLSGSGSASFLIFETVAGRDSCLQALQEDLQRPLEQRKIVRHPDYALWPSRLLQQVDPRFVGLQRPEGRS